MKTLNKVLYLDLSASACGQMEELADTQRRDLLMITLNEPDIILYAAATNTDIKTVVINGSMALFSEQISAIRRILGKEVQFIGASDDEYQRSRLQSAGCDKITGSNLQDVLHLIL